MRWNEIDLEAGVMNLPAARMKAGKDFRVPLSAPATEILRSLPRKDDQFVFPSPVKGKPLSSPTFTRLLGVWASLASRMASEALSPAGQRNAEHRSI